MNEALREPLFREIGEIADSKGVRAMVIGGYVRDYFLKRPSTDIDIVVTGSGIEIAEELGARHRTKVSVFRNFGTAMLRIGKWEVEFVGARKESYRADSRKPVVEDGTLEDDQLRRDFTINTLAFSLNKDSFGELSDPFGGLSDLENYIIRTPDEGDRTFSDDPLRMIRAIRFATQLGFEIEDETFEAIVRQRERIKIVSHERIITELNKIMLSPAPSIGFALLDSSGLLELIFPELHALKGVERVGKWSHKDNFDHTLKVLDNLARGSDNLWLRWAALLHDIGKPRTKSFSHSTGWSFHNHEMVGSKMVYSIFKNLKLPMDDRMKYVSKLVLLHMRPVVLSEDEVTDSAVRRLLFEAGDDVNDLMLLCEADITSANDEKVKRYLANFELVRRKMVEIEEKDRVRNFQPPISGDLIMKTYGIGPRREVGDIKSAIKEAILDGEIENNYDQAYAMMEKLAAGLGLKKTESEP